MKLSVERWYKHFGVVGRVEDEEYLDFIRSQPCLVCLTPPCDPEHVYRQAHGRNDYLAAPLCRKHHTERGAMGVQTWEDHYKIDIKDAILACITTWMILKHQGRL